MLGPFTDLKAEPDKFRTIIALPNFMPGLSVRAFF